MNIVTVMAPVTAIIALLFAYGLSSWIGKTDDGTEKMKEISGYIRESAMAFLKREYIAMLLIIPVFFVLIGLLINWITAVLYIVGAIFSMMVVLLGMRAMIKGSERSASASVSGGMNQAFKIAFRSGAVMGLCVIGLGLLGIGGVFVVLGLKTASVVTGFGLGASSAAFVGRAVSGIYMKAADAVGAVVEKAEGTISEGDPRNPLAIAGRGGGYACHTTGIGLDLFESYSGAIIAAIIIASVTKSIDPVFGYPFDLPALQGSIFPLTISAAGILAAITGIMFVRGNEKSNPKMAVNTGKYLCNTMVSIFSFILSWAFFGNLNCAFSILIGMLIGAVNGKVTDTYTSGSSRHLKKIAKQSQTEYLMISEYGVGMLSVLWPIIFLAAGVLAANAFAGFYGIALAAAGLLTTTGMITAIDVFGPVACNAGEIARIARLSDEDRVIIDQLTSTGRAKAADGKGFVIGAAALTALALIVSYSLIADMKTISLLKPVVIAGLFLGAMLPVLFSALTMNAAGRTASKMAEDVKGQFHSDGGILTGTSKPDYAKCADTGARAALKGIIASGLTAVIAPLAVGIFMGTEALGGFLAGALASGVLVAIILSNTGGAWNHAEKFTAGDPFKDAAGYSINVFIKLMVMVSVVFAPLLASIGGLL